MQNPADIQELTEKLAMPFARAFGEFVRIVSGNGATATPVSRRQPDDGFEVRDVSEEDDPATYKRVREMLAADERKGNVEYVEFDPAVPARHYGSKLKVAFKKRGIKQAVIARKLGVAPSVISRVFKHPEKSKLQTIRKIANAAGISMTELV